MLLVVVICKYLSTAILSLYLKSLEITVLDKHNQFYNTRSSQSTSFIEINFPRMQDNARLHGKPCNRFFLLNRVKILEIDLLSCSSDLNLIDHFRDMVDA